MDTAKTIYGDVKPGDWVIAAGNNDYRYLIGQVKEIIKTGTSEYAAVTTNGADGADGADGVDGTNGADGSDAVHVDFTAFAYPPERMAEIEQRFSSLYGEPKLFNELPLDDVAMAPKALIRISNQSEDEITRMGNLRANCEAFCNCFPGGGEPQNGNHAELIRRVDQNLIEYHSLLMDFGKRELIAMADKIAAMSDAHNYICYRGFDDEELEFLLQFKRPLEVVADGWRDYHADVDDEMGFALDDVFSHKQDWLDSYPLMKDSEPPADLGLRRFMGVDLVSFLGKIAEKVIVHYPNDWNIDVGELRNIAMSDDINERRIVWHVCSMGTHIQPERKVFIRDSGAHEYMTDYHQNDPDMFGYYVEVTGIDGQLITGNVYEVGNYADFARRLRHTALPLDSVTLTYAGDWGVNAGKTLTVSRDEYDNDRQRLMSESGDVIEIVPHPKDERELGKILRDERVYRMSFPIGSIEDHLEKLSCKLAEIRKPPEKTAEQAVPNRKRSIAERLAEAGAEAKAYNALQAQNATNNSKKHKKEID